MSLSEFGVGKGIDFDFILTCYNLICRTVCCLFVNMEGVVCRLTLFLTYFVRAVWRHLFQKNISSGNQRCCNVAIHGLRAGVLKLYLHFTRTASVLKHLEDKRSPEQMNRTYSSASCHQHKAFCCIYDSYLVIFMSTTYTCSSNYMCKSVHWNHREEARNLYAVWT